MSGTWRILTTLVLLLLPAVAHAHSGEELTGLQVAAGYITLKNLVIVACGAAGAAAIGIFFGELIFKVLFTMKEVAHLLGYVVTLGLIGAYFWLPVEYWHLAVFTGSVLLAGMIFITIALWNIKGEDPKGVATILMVLWGAIAIFYGMPSIGFLSVGALMTLLGFSVVVTPLCYAFGFDTDRGMREATSAALMVLSAYMVMHLFAPDAPGYVEVFKPGVFWVSSFVGYCGLLIMASKLWNRSESWLWLQLVSVGFMLTGLVFGLLLGINPLAGMAGVFLGFYILDKIAEIRTNDMMGFAFKLAVISGLLFAAWRWMEANQELVNQYLTTQL